MSNLREHSTTSSVSSWRARIVRATTKGRSLPGGRKFPDTAMDFGSGFRFGQPFFLPVEAYDTRIQILDNVSW